MLNIFCFVFVAIRIKPLPSAAHFFSSCLMPASSKPKWWPISCQTTRGTKVWEYEMGHRSKLFYSPLINSNFIRQNAAHTVTGAALELGHAMIQPKQRIIRTIPFFQSNFHHYSTFCPRILSGNFILHRLVY